MYLKIIIINFFLLKPCVTQTGVRKCECVPKNKCFPDLQPDGIGELDIRIVNGENSTGATTSKPPETCAAGLIQCCTECGISYNITSAPPPGPGQGRYGSQPWQTVIFDDKYYYLGGGVLLDEKHILTAAHKVYAFRNSATKILVRLGEWDVANKKIEPYNVQEANVSAMFIHKDYSDEARNLLNDVAILRLSTPIPYGLTVNPAINTACVPSATENFDKLRCVVSGWGKNAFNGSYQEIIKQVEVPIVNQSECEKRLQTTKLGPRFILDKTSFICAGGEPGNDACVGDGGSPLMCKVKDRYQVAGLVAWGIGCANANVPGVYVRVQSYLDFIKTSIATK